MILGRKWIILIAGDLFAAFGNETDDDQAFARDDSANRKAGGQSTAGRLHP